MTVVRRLAFMAIVAVGGLVIAAVPASADLPSPHGPPAIAAEGGGDFISVFHGSIHDSSAILDGGLDSSRGATFVSRDIGAARDAIGPNNVQFPGRDPGIIESQIPRSDFERVLAPNERGYEGFFPYELNSSEIVLREQEAFDLFNRYIVR